MRTALCASWLCKTARMAAPIVNKIYVYVLKLVLRCKHPYNFVFKCVYDNILYHFIGNGMWDFEEF